MHVNQLIVEVKERQPLWDRSHELRHERSLIDALWEEVAIVLGQSSKNVRAKWKTLKDTYRKEAKKTTNDPSYQSPWANFHSLSFLYDQLGIINISGKTSTTEAFIDQNSSNSNTDQDNKIEFVYENIEMPVENGDGSLVHKGVKRKIKEVSPECITEIFHKEENYFEDEDMCFFKSLVPHVKQLSPQAKMLMRIKIQELVYKEVYSSDLPE